jgi:hypothetical protein
LFLKRMKKKNPCNPPPRGNEMRGAGNSQTGGDASFAHQNCAFFPIEIFVNASSNNFRRSTPIDLLLVLICVYSKYL